jgi:polyisoprenyl-teichoic acid--peptidoglycan teichoic acid transferase
VGYYDTRIRRDPPRRMTRRPLQRTTWTDGQAASGGEYNGVLYARRTGRRRPDLIKPLSVAFGLFLCISLIALGTLIIQNFKPAKAQTPAGIKETKKVAPVVQPGPEGQTKILLLGSDQRPNDGSYRTDVIILMVLDTGKMTVSAVSFPRDLWVEVPGKYGMKINMVHGIGGFPALADTFESSFGVRPDYYLMTNFAGFTRFIDNRGGIDVEVGQELTDSCDLPQAVGGSCTVTPGVVQMDGQTALWYVRSRATSSDYDRLRRAQELVLAVGKKMVKFKTVRQYAKMKDELGENIETNFSPQKAVTLLPFAARLLDSPDRMQRFVIDEQQAYPSMSWDGMWILLPDHDAIRALLREAGAVP